MPDFNAYVRARLTPSGLPAEQEARIVEELAGQLEEHYQLLLDAGRTADDAWDRVQREVPDWNELRANILDGAPLAHRLTHSERRPLPGPHKRALIARLRALGARGLIQDIRLGLRRARKDRGFSLTTLVTLAICLGANAAIFTVVYSVVLRPLPLPDGDRIVAFADQFPTVDPNFSLLNNVRSFFDRPGAVPAVEDQALFRATRRAIQMDGRAEQTPGLEITASFFTLVRTAPALGRAFTDADSQIGNEQSVILSHGLWQDAFAADPEALGRKIDLDGRQFTIVGVMPAGFSFFEPDVRFWVPLTFTEGQMTDTATTRLTYGFYHMGRLHPDADLAQAQAQVDALNAANLERFPDIGAIWTSTRFHTIVVPLHEALVRDVSGILYMLWGGAAFVLLIGAINIGNLTLARSSVRARELATRLAIGASRWRIARLLTIESLLLAALGGVTSVLIGSGILHVIQTQVEAMPGAERIRIDWTVIALTLGCAAVVGTLIGLGSAAGLRKLDLNRAIADDSKGGTRGRRARALRRSLVVAQIAISFVLLVGAGLLLASFRNLLRVDPGFDGSSVVTAALSLPAQTYEDDAAVRAFTERFLDAVRAVPGVASAGITSNVPMGTAGGWGPIIAEEYAAAPGESVVSPWRIVVSPGYLETMGTPLVRGRTFDERDRADAEHVMLVDESLAERFWGDRDPIGTRMFRPTYPEDLNRTDENTEFYRVVGIVRNVQLRDLAGKGGRAFGAFYLPHAQSPGREYHVAIKTRTAPEAVMQTVRAQLAEIDPQLPLFDVRTVTERMDLSLASRKLAFGLAGTFGVVALLLAALGIYGVLAYLVTQRRREIAIRIALGSSSRAVFRLVLNEGLWLTAAGLLLGLIGALAVARVIEDQVFGIAPTSPVVLGTVAAVSGAIALLACLSPARRATRVHPVVVLSDT